MKKFLYVSMFLLMGSFLSSATSMHGEDCPEPTVKDIDLLFHYIRTGEKDSDDNYVYEQHLYKMSCVNVDQDEEEVIDKKVAAMFKKYQHKLYLDRTALYVHVLSQDKDYVNSLVKKYGLDINFDKEDKQVIQQKVTEHFKWNPGKFETGPSLAQWVLDINREFMEVLTTRYGMDINLVNKRGENLYDELLAQMKQLVDSKGRTAGAIMVKEDLEFIVDFGAKPSKKN